MNDICVMLFNWSFLWQGALQSTHAIRMFFYDWQTLIAGALALVGAWFTIKKINEQILQTKNIEIERNIREERAAKAVLPLSLMQIQQYTVDSIKLLAPLIDNPQRQPRSLEEPEQVAEKLDAMVAPRIPENVLQPMQASARYAEPIIAEKFASFWARSRYTTHDWKTRSAALESDTRHKYLHLRGLMLSVMQQNYKPEQVCYMLTLDKRRLIQI